MNRFLLGMVMAAALRGQSLLPSTYATAGPATVERTSATDAGFTEALRITTAKPGRALADASLTWTNSAALRAGTRVSLKFWVRKTAPDDFYNLRGTPRHRLPSSRPYRKCRGPSPIPS